MAVEVIEVEVEVEVAPPVKEVVEEVVLVVKPAFSGW